MIVFVYYKNIYFELCCLGLGGQRHRFDDAQILDSVMIGFYEKQIFILLTLIQIKGISSQNIDGYIFYNEMLVSHVTHI